MAKVYFPEDVDNFIASLGDHQVDILTDLHVMSRIGPGRLDSCQPQRAGIWEYRRLIGPGRYAYLLFAHYADIDSYIVLHGFRAGAEGTTRADLRIAQQRRKAR